MSDLDTATTDELCQELCKRFDAVVIAGERKEHDSVCYINYAGPVTYCYGLAQRAGDRIARLLAEAEEEQHD